MHIVNNGKHISALYITYDTNQTNFFCALYRVSSSIATIVMDWNYYKAKLVNPQIKDQLMLKSELPYFITNKLFCWLENGILKNIGKYRTMEMITWLFKDICQEGWVMIYFHYC